MLYLAVVNELTKGLRSGSLHQIAFPTTFFDRTDLRRCHSCHFVLSDIACCFAPPFCRAGAHVYVYGIKPFPEEEGRPEVWRG